MNSLLISFSFSNSEAKKSQSGEAKRGVKRRIVIRDDSSDEEGDVAGTGPFKLLSDDEASKHSAKVKWCFVIC